MFVQVYKKLYVLLYKCTNFCFNLEDRKYLKDYLVNNKKNNFSNLQNAFKFQLII